MANVQLLVKTGASMIAEDGDIIAVASMAHAWGASECSPHFRVVVKDDAEFYDAENLTMPLDTRTLRSLPPGIRKDPEKWIKYNRVRKNDVVKFRRYRLDENDQIQDKLYD